MSLYCGRCCTRTSDWKACGSVGYCHTDGSSTLTCYQKVKLEKEGFKCLFCDVKFNASFNNQGHMYDEIMISNIKLDFDEKIFVCETCTGKVYDTETNCDFCDSISYMGKCNKLVKMPSGKKQRMCQRCHKKYEKHQALFKIDIDAILGDK